MIHLLKQLLKKTTWHKLPHLRNTLTEEFNPEEMDIDMRLALLAGVAKDPAAVHTLMDEYHVGTPLELLDVIPTHHVVNVGKRLGIWVATVEGAYVSDPYQGSLWPPQLKG